MQQGFSLFEVLISLLIISLGLFGFAEAELKAFKSIRETHQYFLNGDNDDKNKVK
jgi:prepilin-type N-terminal cleavage/methylation domain-containing protein